MSKIPNRPSHQGSPLAGSGLATHLPLPVSHKLSSLEDFQDERGQITIPKELRDRLGLRPGIIFDFTEEHGRLIATKVVSGDFLGESFGLLKIGKSTDRVMEELRGIPDRSILDHRS